MVGRRATTQTGPAQLKRQKWGKRRAKRQTRFLRARRRASQIDEKTQLHFERAVSVLRAGVLLFWLQQLFCLRADDVAAAAHT